MIRPCGSCLTAEFADDDSEDDEVLVVRPGSDTHPAATVVGHLRRPSGSMLRGAIANMVRAGQTGATFTYCGIKVGDDWKQVPR